MGSFEEFDPFAHLSRLGDLTKKKPKTFGFSLTMKVSFDKSDTDNDSFPRVGIPLSSSKISYPHLYWITYFREGSILKINKKDGFPFYSTPQLKLRVPSIFFFMLHRELLAGDIVF